MITTKEIAALISGEQIKRFYHRRDWKHKRKEMLRRDNYECQRCKRKGRYSKAYVVHHIKHLDKFPALALTDSNLDSLCGVCHNEEHPKKLPMEVSKKRFVNDERW